ncbi:transcription antitermination factor NusB [Simkania negevensis]|jgi:N utilization substance protein B|nr:transcription antitermination factor NusB [Simkania negevensis]
MNMVVPQRKFRELVFQMLFSQDLNEGSDFNVITSLLDQLTVTKKTLRQAHERMQCVFEKLGDIDQHISRCSRDYDFNRISRVERNILRLGVFELLYDKDIPPKVALAESIRLGRKFGTPEGGAFVNAVLDAIYRTSEAEPCLSKTS